MLASGCLSLPTEKGHSVWELGKKSGLFCLNIKCTNVFDRSKNVNFCLSCHYLYFLLLSELAYFVNSKGIHDECSAINFNTVCTIKLEL